MFDHLIHRTSCTTTCRWFRIGVIVLVAVGLGVIGGPCRSSPSLAVPNGDVCKNRSDMVVTLMILLVCMFAYMHISVYFKKFGNSIF